MRCRLCGLEAPDFSIDDEIYSECPRCGYVQKSPDRFPNQVEERARYLLHRNDRFDEGYRAFIEEYIDAVEGFMTPGGSVLDFGSGPTPVPASILAERGFAVSCWDPLFAPSLDWSESRWDCVFIHEVAEHFREPLTSLAAAASVIRPGGLLCVRTRFAPRDRVAFASWTYRNDHTHLGFFSARSAEYLAGLLGLLPLLIEEPDRIVLARGERSLSSRIPRSPRRWRCRLLPG